MSESEGSQNQNLFCWKIHLTASLETPEYRIVVFPGIEEHMGQHGSRLNPSNSLYTSSRHSLHHPQHPTGAAVLTVTRDTSSVCLHRQEEVAFACLSKRTGFQMHSNIWWVLSQQITLTSAQRLTARVCWSKKPAWLPRAEQAAWRNLLEAHCL